MIVQSLVNNITTWYKSKPPKQANYFSIKLLIKKQSQKIVNKIQQINQLCLVYFGTAAPTTQGSNIKVAAIFDNTIPISGCFVTSISN